MDRSAWFTLLVAECHDRGLAGFWLAALDAYQISATTTDARSRTMMCHKAHSSSSSSHAYRPLPLDPQPLFR